jgi:MFS superfamily sulfate permease-like transporter
VHAPTEPRPRFVTLLGSIRPYDRSWLSRDVVAGVTLAALAIREVMGYTKIAGTPVITGLYTILLPIVAFGLFASSRHLVVGGDSATAAILYAGIAALGISGLQPYTPQWTALASLAAIIAAVLLILSRLARLGFLADFIAAVVFLIGLKLVDVADMRGIWRLRRDEFWVAAITATVVVCVGVEQGIILAIVLSVILHVRRHYAPHDAVVTWDAAGHLRLSPPQPGTVSEAGLVIYRFGVGLFYANAERFSEEINAIVDAPATPEWLVLQADAIDDVDYTGGKTLLELVGQIEVRGIVVAVAEASEHLRGELDRFGITDLIGTGRYFDTLHAARDAFHARKGD